MHSTEGDILKIIYAAAFILALVICCIVYILMRAQHKIAEIQENRIKAEIDTLENERKRMASDLHDELGPLLSAIKLQISHLEPSDEIEKIILQKSCGQIDEIISRFREISYNLLPNTLVRKGLISAVEEFTGRLQEAHRFSIQFKCTASLTISKEKEINIFRIIQEIIHNTLKHARATKLKIDMYTNNTILILQITDDGIGFNYAEKSINSNGLGLLNLQSRVAVLHAKLNVTSQPGTGTTYRIIIPL